MARGEGERAMIGGSVTTLVGGALAAVGSLLVWAKVSISMAGVGHLSTSVTGMQVGDGKITLAIGILVAVVAAVGIFARRGLLGIGPAIVGIAGGGYVAVVGIMNGQDLKSAAMDEVVRKAGLAPATFTQSARTILGNAMDVAAGWGLYLVILGGVVAVIGGIWAAIAMRDAQRRRGPLDEPEVREILATDPDPSNADASHPDAG